MNLNNQSSSLTNDEIFSLISTKPLSTLKEIFSKNLIPDPNIIRESNKQNVLFDLLTYNENENECFSTLKYLIQEIKIDPYIKDINFQTILFYSVSAGFKLITEYLLDILKFDINQIDINGQNILFYALETNRFELTKYLINKGININVKDNKGNNLLYYLNRDEQWKIVKLLKEKGIKCDDLKKFNKELILKGLFKIKNIWNKNSEINENDDELLNIKNLYVIVEKNNKSKIITDEEIKNKKIFEKCGIKIKREINDNILELDENIENINLDEINDNLNNNIEKEQKIINEDNFIIDKNNNKMDIDDENENNKNDKENKKNKNKEEEDSIIDINNM